MFHEYHDGYRWNKGGRLYSQPQGSTCYQNLPESSKKGEPTRLQMRINGEHVAEIDISSSYLSIFYAWNDQQLEHDPDAYRDILGPTGIDREVAKFWINASFGNGALLKAWTEDLKDELEEKLSKKFGTVVFDPKRYPMKMIKEKALRRHPLLERWGGVVRGRVRGYGDLMFVESEIIMGTMLVLMREHGVPSMPVHDSLIIPRQQLALATEVLTDQFRRKTGTIPSLDPSDPWGF